TDARSISVAWLGACPVRSTKLIGSPAAYSNTWVASPHAPRRCREACPLPAPAASRCARARGGGRVVAALGGFVYCRGVLLGAPLRSDAAGLRVAHTARLACGVRRSRSPEHGYGRFSPRSRSRSGYSLRRNPG